MSRPIAVIRLNSGNPNVLHFFREGLYMVEPVCAENKSDDCDAANASNNKDSSAVMRAYGIRRVPVDYFHYKQFRYTSLKDAIAEARREASER